MREEERAIDRRMRRAVKALRRTEPGWADMTKMQRLDRAAAFAGDTFETEMQQYRMPVPKKGAPLSEEARQAERDRQQRADETFPIRAVRGVRFVRRDGNPADTELTGGRWFTDRPETANTYSGEAGGDMATASMPVRLRLRNPLVVDARNKRFDGIPREWLPEDVQKQAIRGKLLSTDDIAKAAKAMGYDGVIFENLKDDLTSNAITTKPATVYAVFDRKNIRSEFAQFDPARSEDAGLLFQSTRLREGGNETLKKYGLDPNGRYTTREVAAALEARTRAKHGTIERGDYSDEASKKIQKWIIDEVMFEVEKAKDAPEKSAVGWYSTKFQNALDAMSAAFPEFTDEAVFDQDMPGLKVLENQQNARSFFTAILAITSDGAKVADNFRFASQVYEHFRQTGEVMTDVTFGGERNTSMKINLQNIADVLEALGPEQMHTKLLHKETVSELKKIAKQEGKNFSTAYKANMELPYAALVFGPKLGAFYANLMGDTGYLTMDRWWSRTFNRYRGTLLAQPTRDGLERFKRLVTEDRRLNAPAEQMTDDEALALTVDYVKSYKAKKYKNGTEIEKAANTLYKAAFERLEDQPFNASDREFMINTTAAAQKRLKRRGVDLTIADIQAVLWYYEKRLYGDLGAGRTADISYEEIARNVAEGRPDGQDAGQAGRDIRGVPGSGTEVSLDQEDEGALDGEPNLDAEEAFGQDGVDNLFQTIAPIYYSALTNFVATSQQTEATAEQWKQMIVQPARTVRSAKRDPATNRVVVGEDGQPIMLERTVPEVYAPNVTPEEVEWTGVMEWLDLQEGPVTREDLVAFLEQNGVKVEEVVKGGEGASTLDPYDIALQRFNLEWAEGAEWVQDWLYEEAVSLAARLPLPEEYDDAGDWVIAEGAINFFNSLEVDNLREEAWQSVRQTYIEEAGGEVAYARYDDARENDTQWSTYTLPGGENYREMLLTLPERAVEVQRLDTTGWRVETIRNNEWTDQRDIRILDADGAVRGQRSGFRGTDQEALDNVADGNQTTERREKSREVNFRSSHWSEPNVLAHVRFKERVTADGQRTLALEEIQSDWHQAGRQRGYNRSLTDAEEAELQSLQDERDAIVAQYNETGNLVGARSRMTQEERVREREITSRIVEIGDINRRVPNAPFKNNAWANLVLKRMIRWAAENGFDSVSWIPGNIQNGQEVDAEDGRSDFYDKIIPNLANKLGKKYGARVEKVEVEDAAIEKDYRIEGNEDDGYSVLDENGVNVAERVFRFETDAMTWIGKRETNILFWSLPITEEMRQDALEKGFPLFATRGDPKGWGETTPPPDLPPMRLNLAYTRDAYGDEAVRRLPAPIRERAASGSSIDSMLDVIRGVKKTLKRKPPKTLTQWINAKRRGYGKSTVSSPTAKGINGIKGAADELRAMGLEKLINEKSGTDLDYVREAAIEDGFLPEGATVNDLLAAMDAESRGEPTYSRFDEAGVLDLQAAEAWEKMFDDAGINIFEDSDKDLRKKLSDFVSSQNDDAVTPDQAAEKFGFGSGEELLNALANIGNRERYIAEQVRREMQQEFGDPFNDGTLTEKARVMVESELRARAGEIELEALARAVGEVAASRMAKEMARDTLQMLTVKELAQWRRYQQAERREMENAMEAIKRGDAVQAFIHKRRQMVNMHLAREGEKLFEQIEKQRKDLQKYETSKNRRDRIAPDYLEKIDDLLAHFELRVSKQGPKEQRRRLSAAEWVAQMDADGREAEVSDEARLLAELADKKVWRSLTAQEVEFLAATVKNLAHLGRLKDHLLSEQEKRRISAIVDDMVEAMQNTGAPKGAQREYSNQITMREKATRFLRTSHHWLMRPEHQFRALDGQDNGPVWNALFRPFADAADMESRMLRETAKEVRKAYEMYSLTERFHMHNTSIALPELGAPTGKRWTKMDVITMALNWGVQYNRDALVEGYGWTEDQVNAALDRVMSDKDWDFVEEIWRISGKYKDEAFALEKAMTGVEPKSVEGMTFTTGSGRRIEGKYYHLEYDSRQLGRTSRRQKNQEDKEALKLRNQSFTKPMTRNGALKNRVGSGGKPVKLHISVFDKAIADTIHDIAYRRAVIDVTKLIQNDRFADAYEQVSGKEGYDQLMPWVDAIAKPPSDQVQGWAKILVTARQNLPIAYMGYKIGTALIQPTGLLAGVPVIGWRYFGSGLAKAFGGNPASIIGAWQAVAEKSEFMRDRPQGYDRDVREITTKMGDANPIGAVKRNAFVLISAMDIAVSTPLWIGAYDKALAGKVKGIDRGNEEDAIAYADSVIRRTQTAGRTQDLARAMRDNELWKQVTMIMGYFSNLYGLNAQQLRSTRAGEQTWMQYAFMASILFVAIPVLAELMAGRLVPDDDDDETMAGLAGEAVISNFAGQFPVLRDFVNYRLKPEYGYNLSPVASGLKDVAQSTTVLDDGEITDAEARRMVRALGALLGIPSSQLVITGDYVLDVAAGEEDPLAEPERIVTEGLVRNTDY